MGGVIMLVFTMGSNLSCYQLRRDYYSYKLQVSLMVTAKQNLQQIQKRERERNINTKESHETTKKEKKTENYKNSQKTIKKMAISTNLSIITLNVNGLNSPIKTHTVVEQPKIKKPIYMFPTRNSFQM